MKQISYRAERTLNAGLQQHVFIPGNIVLIALLIVLLSGCVPNRSPETKRETLELILTDTSAVYPTTAIDPIRGTVYVAYTQGRGRQTDVYLQRLDAGTHTFRNPVRVNNISGDAAAHAQAPAQVVVASDGTVYVVWISQTPVEGRRFPASDIRLARSTDSGQTFEPAITVNENAGFPTSHHFHNVAVGPDGTVYVSWLDGEEQDRALARSNVHLASSAGHAHGHGENSENNGPGTQLKVARSTNGGRTFEPGVVVAEGTCQCCRTALSIAPIGTVYVAWRHIFGDQIRDMALSRSEDGGRTFTEPIRVHADNWQINGCPHSGPSLAVDEQSQVHLIWYTGAEKGKGINYAISRDGGKTFKPVTRLVSDVPVSQVGASATGSRIGVLLTWEHPLTDSVYVQHAAGSNLSPLRVTPGKTPSVTSSGEIEVFTWSDGSQIHLRVERKRNDTGIIDLNVAI